MPKTAGFAAALCLLLSLMAAAQDHRADVSISGGDAISKSVEGNGVSHTATQSLNVMGSLRLHFSPRSAVDINYAHATDSQKYDNGVLSYRLPTTVAEFTGAYVFSFHQSAKLHPFALAGGGVLVFNPNDSLINGIATPIGAVRQTRPAFLYGVGADYRLISRFALRLQYRGLVFSAPDFDVPALFTSGKGHMAQVMVGISFGF